MFNNLKKIVFEFVFAGLFLVVIFTLFSLNTNAESTFVVKNTSGNIVAESTDTWENKDNRIEIYGDNYVLSGNTNLSVYLGSKCKNIAMDGLKIESEGIKYNSGTGGEEETGAYTGFYSFFSEASELTITIKSENSIISCHENESNENVFAMFGRKIKLIGDGSLMVKGSENSAKINCGLFAQYGIDNNCDFYCCGGFSSKSGSICDGIIVGYGKQYSGTVINRKKICAEGGKINISDDSEGTAVGLFIFAGSNQNVLSCDGESKFIGGSGTGKLNVIGLYINGDIKNGATTINCNGTTTTQTKVICQGGQCSRYKEHMNAGVYPNGGFKLNGNVEMKCISGKTTDNNSKQEPAYFNHYAKYEERVFIDNEAELWFDDNRITGSMKDYQMKTTINTSKWLNEIPDEVSFSSINYPGTHDSGTYNIKSSPNVSASANYPETYSDHNRTIYEQLHDGIRIFDIRLQITPYAETHGMGDSMLNENPEKAFQINHGPAECYLTDREISQGFTSDTSDEVGYNLTLDTVIQECKRFLEENPSEVAVLMFQVNDGSTDKQKELYNYYEPLLLNKYKVKKNNVYSISYAQGGGVKAPTLGEIRGNLIIQDKIMNKADIPQFWQGEFEEKISTLKAWMMQTETKLPQGFEDNLSYNNLHIFYTNLSPYNVRGTRFVAGIINSSLFLTGNYMKSGYRYGYWLSDFERPDINEKFILTNSFKLQRVTGFNGKLQNKSIILEWNRVNGATDYDIYRKFDTDKEYLNEPIATVSSNDELKYIDSANIVEGKTYDYLVIAKNSKKFTEKSEGCSCCVEVPHMCNLNKVRRKSPTCTEAGHTAYWECDACGKIYLDSRGQRETTKNRILITPKVQ